MNRNVARAFAASITLIAGLLSGVQTPATAAVVPTIGTSLVSSAGTGATIKVTPATWPLPVSKRAFQWMLNGKPIAGKTSTSLKLATSYLGKRVSVRESVTFKNKAKATATSNVLRVGQIAYTGEATLGYPNGDNTKLKVTLPDISTQGVTATFLWQRGPFDIAGSTSEHVITVDDYGVNLSAVVKLKAKGFSTVELFTNVVAVNDPSVAGPGVKTLLWEQNFDSASGTAADSTYWTADIGDGTAYQNPGWGNSEKQWYSADASKQDGSGNMVITATKGSTQTCYYGKCQWQSGKLTTKGKIGFKYGYLEARIKGPVGKGTWPAFWMLGANYREVPGQSTAWPDCGEIDIFETTGDFPNRNFGTPHSPGMHAGGTVDMQVGTGQDYHTYAINWSPNKIAWYVDDSKFFEINKVTYGANPYPFNSEFYAIMNVAIGGWGGEPASDLTSATMKVDYIKFYSVDGVGEVIRH